MAPMAVMTQPTMMYTQPVMRPANPFGPVSGAQAWPITYHGYCCQFHFLFLNKSWLLGPLNCMVLKPVLREPHSPGSALCVEAKVSTIWDQLKNHCLNLMRSLLAILENYLSQQQLNMLLLLNLWEEKSFSDWQNSIPWAIAILEHLKLCSDGTHPPPCSIAVLFWTWLAWKHWNIYYKRICVLLWHIKNKTLCLEYISWSSRSSFLQIASMQCEVPLQCCWVVGGWVLATSTFVFTEGLS